MPSRHVGVPTLQSAIAVTLLGASRNLSPRAADVDSRSRGRNRRNRPARGQHMADQFGERIRLRGQKGLGLDDQVLVARVIELRDKVDRKRPGSRVVVRGRKLVDDRRHVRRRVL